MADACAARLPDRRQPHRPASTIPTGKRLRLVADIQRKLEAEVARPMLGWRNEYFTSWPYVKNLLPHNSLYNYARMQEVWLDK